MQASTSWWIATGLLVAAELAARMGANSNLQIVVAAVIGGGQTGREHRHR